MFTICLRITELDRVGFLYSCNNLVMGFLYDVFGSCELQILLEQI